MVDPRLLEPEARNLRTSFAVVPGIRQVSTARLHELSAQVAPDVLERLTGTLGAYLGD